MDKIVSVAADNRLEAANIKGISIEGVKNNQNVQLNLYFVPADVDVQNAAELLASQYTSTIQAPRPETQALPTFNLPSITSTLSSPASTPPSNTATFNAPSPTNPLNFNKLRVANELQPALQTIANNSYGNGVLNQILNHPALYSLTIQTHPQSSAERERLGATPSAETELTFYDNGQISAVITMDADMLAQVMTTAGQGLTVDADNILFHELSHVLLELNQDVNRNNRDTWQRDAEVIASNYESNYGGYQRDYFREGSYAFWA